MNQPSKQTINAIKIENFLKEHKNGYSAREIDFIRRCWQMYLDKKFNVDILRQIYSELNIIDEKDDIYHGFMKILEENFDIDTDIIEVGGGRIPSLAKKIALKQKKGTITVYDPDLISTKSKIPNMVLRKQPFTLQTPVQKDQLIIGFMPCEAAEKIIYNARNNGAHFLIALCEGGPHGDEFDYFESDDEWLTSMLYSAKDVATKIGHGPLQITDLKEYDDPYPVIYTKKR
jgi:hypothetical protein